LNEFPIQPLLTALDADPACANAKLEEIYRLLNKFFQCSGFPDPEELAQEVVYRVTMSLSRGARIVAADASSYFLGFAINVRREQWKKLKNRKARETDTSVEVPATQPSFGNLTETEMQILLQECMRGLEAAEKELLLNYYTHGREWLCRQTEQSPAYITLKVYRIREKIRRLLNLTKNKIS
jgi:DNA-directed RNA polymerase specialized sigma24 family protein